MSIFQSNINLFSDDFQLCILWNIVLIFLGGLLHRLTGHTKQAMLSVPDVGPYFLSYGFMGEEVIKLWDRTNFQCIASFTLDTTVSYIIDYLYIDTAVSYIIDYLYIWYNSKLNYWLFVHFPFDLYTW